MRTTATRGPPRIVLASSKTTRREKLERRPLVRGTYALPEELTPYAPRRCFAPSELSSACREAGERLGREDAREANFRTAAQMVQM
jgi:hypothetical protein